MNQFSPPHLPESKSEELSKKSFTQIRIVFVVVILSLFAGMVGALIVVAWIIPSGYVADGFWVPRTQNVGAPALYTEPDTSIVRKVRNITVDVFFEDKMMENGFYTQDAFVGEGVMLSSNGWGVLFAPELSTQSIVPKLRVRDIQNTIYTPTSVIADKKTGFIYFKLSGTEFYVASFPDWRTITSGIGVWKYTQGEWRRQTVGEWTKLSVSAEFSAGDERVRFNLLPEGFADRGIVANDTGNIVGFVDREGRLRDAWSIENTIPHLLQIGNIDTPTIDWEGSLVETIEAGKKIQGFLIDSPGKATGAGIKRGDVVRAINGNPITESNLYRLVRETPLTATVWRNGEIFDILVNN